MWRVVFCVSKGHEATGSARHGRLQLAQLVELSSTKRLVEGSTPSLPINAKTLPVYIESALKPDQTNWNQVDFKLAR